MVGLVPSGKPKTGRLATASQLRFFTLIKLGIKFTWNGFFVARASCNHLPTSVPQWCGSFSPKQKMVHSITS